MMARTKIAWSEFSWNPVIGCTKIATGCKNCYAEKMATRLATMPLQSYYRHVVQNGKWNGDVYCMKNRLSDPLHWRKPRRIFVCSMSDLFHEDVPFEFIHKIFVTMKNTPRHTYQVLTKRPERVKAFVCWEEQRMRADIDWVLLPLDNVWLGTSCSTQDEVDKNIPILLRTPAAVRFLSIEPLLSQVDLDQPCPGSIWATGLDQIIVGCESLHGGRSGRPCKIEWVRDIVRQCKDAGVKIFVKQIEINGKVSHDPAEWPEDVRVRENPK